MKLAITNKYTDIAKILINSGADVNLSNDNGGSPLITGN